MEPKAYTELFVPQDDDPPHILDLKKLRNSLMGKVTEIKASLDAGNICRENIPETFFIQAIVSMVIICYASGDIPLLFDAVDEFAQRRIAGPLEGAETPPDATRH